MKKYLTTIILLCATSVWAGSYYFQKPDLTTLPDTSRILVYDAGTNSDKNVTGALLKSVMKNRTTAWGFVTGKPTVFSPTVHGSSHQTTGIDPLTLTTGQISGLDTVLSGKVDDADARLTDARTPLAHSQGAGTITGLATVATSGSYTDLSNKPTIPAAASEISYTNPTYTTVGAALDQLLYVPISITSFTMNGSGSNVTQEIGSSYTVSTLAWATNKTPSSQTINSVARTSPYSVNTTVTTNTTYTLYVADGSQSNASSSRSVSFSHKRYWGVSSNTTLTDAQIIALTSEYSGSRAQTRNGMVASSQYIYFAYPDSWGAATFTVNGLPSTAWTLVQRAFVNAAGNSTTFRIYRSDNLLTGTYNVVIS